MTWDLQHVRKPALSAPVSPPEVIVWLDKPTCDVTRVYPTSSLVAKSWPFKDASLEHGFIYGFIKMCRAMNNVVFIKFRGEKNNVGISDSLCIHAYDMLYVWLNLCTFI